MKLFLKIILCLFGAFILIGAGAMFYLTRGLEVGSEIVVNEMDLTSLDDGTYNGKYKSGRWSNEVNVTVKEHQITKIDMVKDVVFVQPDIREEIFNMVIEKQNTNVDTISGATVTCKAYLKSIENALIGEK